MSTIPDLEAKLRDTIVAIAHVEQTLGPNPSAGALAGLRSMRQRKQRLESELLSTARVVGVEVDLATLYSNAEAQS